MKITGKKIKKSAVTLLMIPVIVIMVFPLYLLVTNSFKTIREFYANPLSLPSKLYLDNFKYVLEKQKYFSLLLNNVIIVFGSIALLVLFGAMAGYVLGRSRGRVMRILYSYVVLGITLPTYTMLLPQLKLIVVMGLKNTYIGIILYYVASGMPMAIFLFNGFFSTAPKDLEEAAKLDGCSLYRAFFQIFFPLSVATIATLVLIQSISIWNDTTMPVLLLQAKKRTLMPTLQNFYGRMMGQGTRWERIYADAVLCMLPMIVLFFASNRFLIQGVSEGALKG
ncbi:MAG: carbohydrate ABC transporter permease [Clostridia bacterium]|nr:carbohydrate ABC transporter permease [Clostridia bacterium]